MGSRENYWRAAAPWPRYRYKWDAQPGPVPINWAYLQDPVGSLGFEATACSTASNCPVILPNWREETL